MFFLQSFQVFKSFQILSLGLLTFNYVSEQQLDFCSLHQVEQLMLYLMVSSSVEAQAATIYLPKCDW